MRKRNAKNHMEEKKKSKLNAEKRNYFILALITTTRKNPATMSVISIVNFRYLITEGLMHCLKIVLDECYGGWQEWVLYLGQENNTTEIPK